MSISRSEQSRLLRRGIRTALEERARLGLPRDGACDVFEVAARTVDLLHFKPLRRGDGAYLAGGQDVAILVSSLRPIGRQRYTVAHELGHHRNGHGSTVDGDLGESVDLSRVDAPDEIVAEGFARYLLMPRPAVVAAFGDRSRAASATPAEVLRAAGWLGVGYRTLLNQACHFLQLIPEPHFRALARVTPSSIRKAAVGTALPEDLWLLDARWRDSRLHVQVGDVILGLKAVRPTQGKGHSLVEDAATAGHRARYQGRDIGTLSEGGKVEILVTRREFSGLYDYRYLPEVP